MAFNPSNIPLFNKAQMSPLNDLGDLDDLGSLASLWLGELSGASGEMMASGVLVGPITGQAPMAEKKWDSIELSGKGRALVIAWIDNRKVAQGLLNMAGGHGLPNVLNIPQGIHTGYSLLLLIIFQGQMLGCKTHFEPVA
jgi:hypothetical protein